MRNITRSILLSTCLIGVTAHLKAATVTVYVYNNEFSINQPPGPVVDAVIYVGDVIRWQHVQGNHTTTSVPNSTEQWDSPISNSNQVFEYQFNTPGVYWYYCIPHGDPTPDGNQATGMAGTITVLSADAGACCMPNGTCDLATMAACMAMGGTFQGVGTDCSPNPCAAGPMSITLNALKDNSIYAENGAGSNGGGTSLFTGVRQNNIRRSLLAFDLAAIPAGSSITAVELRVTATTVNTSQSVALHRLGADWGEGTAAGNMNTAGTAGTGDATWTHRFFDTQSWTTPGGQFEATASASTTVAATGQIVWTSATLLSDVQMWQSMPAMNRGWMMLANEVTNNVNVTFASRESATAADRPQLVVTYVPAGPSGACCMPDGSCMIDSEGSCTMMGGTYFGDGSTCAETYCTVALTPFIDALPLPGVAQPVTGTPGGTAHYELAMTEQFQQLHSQLPPTRTWGYAGSYPGPTIEARRGLPITVQWHNDLRVAETGELRTTHPFYIDECMHGPDVTGSVPVGVVHLHGGKTSPESDGPPEAVFAPGQSAPIVYDYPNKQQAATIWYHDHALGITRLNVMMGLAGFYLIRDEVEDALGLPAGEFEVPMAIQDRQLNGDGSLRYPEELHDHFFGDKILVNGKVWPFLNVKQGKYRFRMVNGSNSRTYTLALSNNATFHQIGTDGGLLPAPVPLTSVTFLPGERVDLVFDFSGYPAGTELILTNSAPAPFPGFPGVGVVPDVMKFIVTNEVGYTLPLPSALADVPPIPAEESSIERVLDLVLAPSHCPEHTHPMWTIDGLMWDDITELPIKGATEIWTWKNNSGISHPMHLHMEFGQILNRQAIDDVTGEPTGPLLPPAANEMGWKDTWDAPTGYFTRVIFRFDAFTGLYPYHCHILEHEDHEMMRQFLVVDPVRVNIRMMLEGPYDPMTGLMHDSLRVKGLIPLKEPYGDLGYPLIGGVGVMIAGHQLEEAGPQAIVDWVLVELRDAVDPTLVLRTRTALLLRDGSVMAFDGTPHISFDVVPGNYHIVVKHRNHLGVMTASPLALDASITDLDLADPATPTFGTGARRNIGVTAVLWAGDVSRDQELKYTGTDNDRDPILVRIGGTVPTNVATGYFSEDVNMDGRASYTGTDNDRDPILMNIGGIVPTLVRPAQLP